MTPSFIRLMLACAVALIALLGYSAWYGVVAGESSAVASMEGEIEAKSAARSRVAAARAVLAEIAGDEATIREYFVPDTGAVSFIDGLEARGRAQGADISVRSISTGKANAHAAFLLTVSIAGAFNAVMQTLGSIEYAPYDLSVANLVLNKNASGTWQATADLAVGLTHATTTTTTP